MVSDDLGDVCSVSSGEKLSVVQWRSVDGGGGWCSDLLEKLVREARGHARVQLQRLAGLVQHVYLNDRLVRELINDPRCQSLHAHLEVETHCKRPLLRQWHSH